MQQEQAKTVRRANEWMQAHTPQVKSAYKPRYHASVPCGWANDPNGLIWYQGEAHLFYQHNPYAPRWDTMHWGHMSSTDLLHWHSHDEALASDMPYDREVGCFSGTALAWNDRLWLMYAGALNGRQQQCLAVSADGEHFEKMAENPVISTAMLPEGYAPGDFRDPKLFCRDGCFYCIAATRNARGGNLLLYRAKDLTRWEYVGALFTQQGDGSACDFLLPDGVCECPDYAVIDGQEVLIFSPQNLPQQGHRYQNISSTVYMIGHLDTETGRFTCDRLDEIDGGFDFYAAQTMHLPDDRTVMIAWQEMWGRNYPTQADGWAGSFTLPRELHVQNGRLVQKPVREAEQLWTKTTRYERVPLTDSRKLPDVQGDVAQLQLRLHMGSAKRAGVTLMGDGKHETRLVCDREAGTLTLDRSDSGLPMGGEERDKQTRTVDACLTGDVLELCIFLDVSSVEAFVGGGKQTLTAHVYPELNGRREISFFAEEGEAELLEVCFHTL